MCTSDHFAAYVALVGSALALLGTLCAVFFTRHFEQKREAMRAARENQIRLHDMRVSAYVDFLSATSEIFEPSDVRFLKALIDGSSESVEKTVESAFPKYIAAHSRVILVASASVLKTVAEVDGAIQRLVRSTGPEAAANALDALQAARNWFFREARAELGISEMDVAGPISARLV